MIGEGNLGLIRAAEDFESRFGTRFSTYAAYWIKQAIRYALINTTSTIRLPAHMIGLLTKCRRAERALTREQGKAPSLEAVASVLRLSQTKMMLAAHARCAVRFTKEGTDALVTAWHASAERSNRSQACDATLELDDELHMVLQQMQRLDTRERTVLELRYGLRGGEPMTLKEIGRLLGITREWVRKIEVRALRKLRDEPNDQADQSQTGRQLPVKRRPRLDCPPRPLSSNRQLGM